MFLKLSTAVTCIASCLALGGCLDVRSPAPSSSSATTTSSSSSAPPIRWVDASGNFYIADTSNQAVREVTASTGIIATVAGTPLSSGFSGDSGPATSAQLSNPVDVVLDSSNNLYIADVSNRVIRKVAASTGIISTVAGTHGSAGYSGDNGPATSAQLSAPEGIAVDSAGNLYIADPNNHIVREVNAVTGIITTVAGTPLSGGFSGDNGPATSATLDGPMGVALDGLNNIYIADTYDHVVRKVDAITGIITTVAGISTTSSYTGDGGAATAATLGGPTDVAVDRSNNLYILDCNYNVVREVNAETGIITTVAGNGTQGYLGDNGPATSAELGGPNTISLDSSGNIYIGDSGNHVIRKVDAATGIITTIAGNGSASYSGDGGSATSAELNWPDDTYD